MKDPHEKFDDETGQATEYERGKEGTEPVEEGANQNGDVDESHEEGIEDIECFHDLIYEQRVKAQERAPCSCLA